MKKCEIQTGQTHPVTFRNRKVGLGVKGSGIRLLEVWGAVRHHEHHSDASIEDQVENINRWAADG